MKLKHLLSNHVRSANEAQWNSVRVLENAQNGATKRPVFESNVNSCRLSPKERRDWKTERSRAASTSSKLIHHILSTATLLIKMTILFPLRAALTRDA